MGCKFNLKKISDNVKDAKYNPKRSPGLCLHLKRPKGTVLVNSGGRLILTGVKSKDDLTLVAEKCAKLFRKLGFRAKVLQYEIKNIHAHVNLGFTMKLDELVVYAQAEQRHLVR